MKVQSQQYISLRSDCQACFGTVYTFILKGPMKAVEVEASLMQLIVYECHHTEQYCSRLRIYQVLSDPNARAGDVIARQNNFIN